MLLCAVVKLLARTPLFREVPRMRLFENRGFDLRLRKREARTLLHLPKHRARGMMRFLFPVRISESLEEPGSCF